MKKLQILLVALFGGFFMISAQDFNFNKTTVFMDSTINSSLLVCKLTGPELQERKAALQQEIFTQMEKVEEVKNGYIFFFENEEDFIVKLMDYTLAEKKCCPFFQFDLKIKPDRKGIELGLTGPEGAKEMIKELVDNL